MDEKKEKNNDRLYIILAIFIVLFVPAIILGCLYLKRAGGNTQATNNKEVSDMSNMHLSTEATPEDSKNSEDKMTYFTGYDSIYAAQGSPVYLKNESDNAESRIYMEYEIYDEEDNFIYKSGLIEAGKQTEWDATQYFLPGTYSLRFHQQPYRMEDESSGLARENMTPLYFVDQNVTVTVE